MSYLSTGIGPSPFLASSHHHFHNNNYTSSRPNYSTNSYTNTPSHLAAYATPLSGYQQKYFPKEMINVLPGVTNLSSEEEQKIIHPLNTYSGNVFSTHQIMSPFNRGQIYHGNKDPIMSSTCSSPSNMMDHIGSESYLNKIENPFNKKYLLSDKNKQLENYAFCSSLIGQDLSDYSKINRTTQKVNKNYTRRENQVNNDQMTEYVLKMISNQNINLNRDTNLNQNYEKFQKISQRNKTYENPFQKHILRQNYQQEYMVESQVDQKQFGSFGQGKERNKNNMDIQDYKSYQNSNQNLYNKKNDQTQSFIVGLTKMVPHQKEKFKSIQQKTKREPVFIESEDERKSGTFKVPDAIIDEINNPRIPSSIICKKENIPVFSHEKEQQFQRQRAKYSKEQATQVGRNPPSKIMMRGKTYEKISL